MGEGVLDCKPAQPGQSERGSDAAGIAAGVRQARPKKETRPWVI
jgi:hypothetical protein